MTKRIAAALLIGVFVLVSTGLALAGANPRKGKYLFRKTCRTCHAENAKGAVKAPDLSPSTKTQAQWKRAFKAKKIAKYECAEEWAKIKAEDLEHIQAYLIKYAADSPTPAKCK